MTTCRSCGAPIRWVVLPSGKRIPLDLAPHPEGDITVGGGERARVLDAEELAFQRRMEAALGSTAQLFRPHFVRCPPAAAHRPPKQPEADA